MDFETLKEKEHKYLMQTYSRFDVALDHGAGSTFYGLDGREYIDFTSGIGVNSLGSGDEKWVSAVVEQAVKLAHTSNLYYTEPSVRLAETLCERSGMSRVFFANSGAEGNEGMIKLARKYSFDKYGKGRGTILTLKNSFHGRTATMLAATGQEKFHNYFFPFADGFRFGEASIDGVEAVAGHDVCAVMLELVQGESGVYPMEREFIHDLAVLCAERDWLLLLDEVQTGIGRTGTLFAYQQYGVLPDAVSFSKGIAGGLPFGGFLVSDKCRDVLGFGDHGSTFGGNPICSAAAMVVLERLDEAMLQSIAEKGDYLRRRIEEMNLPGLGKTRGLGLMIGIEVAGERSNRELAALLAENGLLCLTAGPALRLLPPLVITREEMDKGLAILQKTLEGLG